jgi:hypothetical protein
LVSNSLSFKRHLLMVIPNLQIVRKKEIEPWNIIDFLKKLIWGFFFFFLLIKMSFIVEIGFFKSLMNDLWSICG